MFRRQVDRRQLATVLFTDIVGSTERAATVGDRRWREIIAEHHAILRRALRSNGGREVDTAGDGFFATFERPAQAIACATDAIEEVRRRLGIEIRAGIHTGEVERTGPKVGGIAVHIGARLLALAGPGEVLVTSTVRELVGGSGLRFADRGTHDLKGVPEPWHLYALEVTPATADQDGGLPASGSAEPRPDVAAGARRRALGLGAAALAAAGLLAIYVLALTGRGPAGTPSPSPTARPTLVAGPDAVVALAADGTQVGGQVVGATPGDVVVGGDQVWVASLGSSTVSRIDPGGASKPPIGAVGRPSALAYETAADRLWVLDGLASRLSVVDARTGQPLDSFRQPGRGLDLGTDVAWVAHEVGDAVVAIDLLSRRPVATISLPTGSAPVAVAVGRDAIWVAAKGSSEVLRIDPATRALVEGGTSVSGSPTAIAVGDSVWVASGPGDAVIRLDPADGRVAQTYTDVCDEPGGIVAAGAEAWVTCRRDGTVLRMGAGGVSVTAQVGFVPNDVAHDGTVAWVTLAEE